MRAGRAFSALALFFSLFLVSIAAATAMAAPRLAAPSPAPEPSLVVRAKLVCGFQDGSFGCHQESGDIEMGKNRTPGSPVQAPETAAAPPAPEAPAADTPGQTASEPGAAAPLNPGEHVCPAGYRVLAVPGPNGYCEPPGASTAAAAPASACEHGMQGTPPNCHCPPSSELLGGNCVHYTATCKTALAANAAPEACPKDDQKLACKTRSDGLKDCCCLTYDKL